MGELPLTPESSNQRTIHPMLAYLMASYCGGVVYLFTTETPHGLPLHVMGFVMAPIQPLMIFVGLFSGAGYKFALESLAFGVITFVAYKLLRKLWPKVFSRTTTR